METKDAQTLAEDLMKQHGVENYSFSFMAIRKKFSTSGRCNWKKKTIQLQPTFVELNTENIVRNTVLHEIAHALRPKHGHNKFWRSTAASIGCTGLRCYGKEVIKS